MTDNIEKIVQEADCVAAADEYFKARTWLMDTNDNRRIFEAGFDRAYALLSKLRAEGVQAGDERESEHIETLQRMRADYNPSDGPMSELKATALDAAIAALASAPVAKPKRAPLDDWRVQAIAECLETEWDDMTPVSAEADARLIVGYLIAYEKESDEIEARRAAEPLEPIVQAIRNLRASASVAEPETMEEIHRRERERAPWVLPKDPTLPHSAPVAGEAQPGYAVVPIEPTKEMLSAAFDLFELSVPEHKTGNDARRAIYIAMVNAAPQASEAVRNQALEEAAEIAENSYADAHIRIRALKTQADKDGGDCAKGAGDVRTWQRLTDSERDGFVGELVDYDTDFVSPLYAVVESIERRLREKNATPSVVKQSLTATQTGEKGESDA